MASQFDDTDFIDREFQQSKSSLAGSPGESGGKAPERLTPLPTREDLEAKVGDTQMRLAELKRQQDELEQQRVALEEVRRRRKEFHDGTTEMRQHLIRGISLLEETVVATQRDAVQMNQTLEDFRQALEKISSFSEDSWTAENVEVELTRALTAIENARMEWNAARFKWSFLDGEESPVLSSAAAREPAFNVSALSELSFVQLCRLGFALNWPLAAILGLLAAVVLVWRLFS